VIPCIEEGFFQRELARSAYRYQQELEAKERIVVGVNDFVMENEVIDIPVLKIDRTVEPRQISDLKKIKERRNNGAVQVALDRLSKAAAGDGNTFEAMMDCAREYATVGEMCDVLRATWGEWSESAQAMQVS
jgi:methylmalonyl-CoA mutase N-terminal domain/subunit